MRDLALMGEPQPDPTRGPERGNRAIWGDEPEEVDASTVVEELETGFPDAARRWHDHPVCVPFKAVGGFLVIVGVALLVLPGPGLLVIILGLGILATEYVWAERLLKMAKDKATQAKDKVLRKKPAGDDIGGA